MNKKYFRIMTKVALTLSLAGISALSSNVFAAEKPANPLPSKPLSDDPYEDLKDDQIVIACPEGGFIVKKDGSSNFSEAHVRENNGTLMTVKELKKQNRKDSTVSGNELFNNNITPFRAPTPNGTTVRYLANGEAYRSEAFSGSGWRFSGYRFYPASGTGGYLAWTSIKDDGRVGDLGQAGSTYAGHLAGTALYAREGRKYIWSQNGMLYYTFNPISGTRYVVENW